MARELGAEALDVALFAERSHLEPAEVFADLPRASKRVKDTLDSNGLRIADAFGQASLAADAKAINHPDPAPRAAAREFFYRLLEFALRCNGVHMTVLPGTSFPGVKEEDSIQRSAEELAWRVEEAAKVGVVMATEAHYGSIVPTPQAAARLLELTPGLTLTLDYTHFTYQGYPDSDVEPLMARTSHFHARGGCKGKIQAPMSENSINYGGILRAMKKANYKGYVVLEYVWTEWMDLNRVDNVSETILLRDHLLELEKQQ